MRESANQILVSLSGTTFCKMVIKTIVAVKLSIIADSIKARIAKIHSNFFLDLVFEKFLIVKKTVEIINYFNNRHSSKEKPQFQQFYLNGEVKFLPNGLVPVLLNLYPPQKQVKRYKYKLINYKQAIIASAGISLSTLKVCSKVIAK